MLRVRVSPLPPKYMTTHKVYWTEGDTVFGKQFTDMVVALGVAQDKRREGHSFVVMASESVNQVGSMGVDGVIDGKLPSGETYDWKKRRD